MKLLSGSTLKLIAIFAMTIDHFAASIIYYGFSSITAPSLTILQIYNIMRIIGRIAFPIFCFLLVEGFFYTSNRKKYALRLFAFALISEFPFDFAIFNTTCTWQHQNVFFTLLLGFFTIWVMEEGKNSRFRIPIQVCSFLAGCGLAYLLRTDYEYYGILLIVVLYVFREHRLWQTVGGCLSLLWEAPACLAFLPINMYNGKRGISLKYIFYAFYPVHLLLFGLILRML